jgi:UDP:flavonoid glycosyltransferase YjiC (YdhE family)
MRALVITVGSRGDAEPCCALARALVQAEQGWEVDLFLQTDLQYLASRESSAASSTSQLTLHTLPFTMQDFYTFSTVSPTHGADDPNPRVRFIGIVTDIIAGLVLPCAGQVKACAASQGADVIVTTPLARPLALAVATALQLPVCLLNLQPLAPNDVYPHYSHVDDCVAALMRDTSVAPSHDGGASAASYAASYWSLERTQHAFLQERLDAVYDDWQIPRLAWDDAFRNQLAGRDGPRTIVAQAVSTQLVPHVFGASSAVHTVGPLADAFCEADFVPPPDLVAFLQACTTEDDDPPLCVGYGSMPFGRVPQVLAALQEVNRKAILVGTPFCDAVATNAWTASHVFYIRNIPYPWLLPQCRTAMLHHGGAGVVQAALRAGIPSVISPLLGDQFGWAKLLEAKGLGVAAGTNLTAVTQADLVAAIHKAEACRPTARETGVRIRAGPGGAATLAALLQQQVEDYARGQSSHNEAN